MSKGPYATIKPKSPCSLPTCKSPEPITERSQSNSNRKLKRYLVFQFQPYHPAGGWADFKESVDELDSEFIDKYQDCRFTLQVIDSHTGKIISN